MKTKDRTIELAADLLCIRNRILGLVKRERAGKDVDWFKSMLDVAKNIEIPSYRRLSVKYNGK